MIAPHPKRPGPGWPEIALSLGCTMLIATGVLTGRASVLPQTAEAYYTAFKEVKAFHFWDVAVNLLILVTTMTWIFLASLSKWPRFVIVFLALAGLGLVWAELVWARNLHSEPLFSLRELPFRPVGNSGIVGAELFGAYLLVQLPSGKLSGWQAVILKGGLALCFWMLQVLLWDGIRRSV